MNVSGCAGVDCGESYMTQLCHGIVLQLTLSCLWYIASCPKSKHLITVHKQFHYL